MSTVSEVSAFRARAAHRYSTAKRKAGQTNEKQEKKEKKENQKKENAAKRRRVVDTDDDVDTESQNARTSSLLNTYSATMEKILELVLSSRQVGPLPATQAHRRILASFVEMLEPLCLHAHIMEEKVSVLSEATETTRRAVETMCREAEAVRREWQVRTLSIRTSPSPTH